MPQVIETSEKKIDTSYIQFVRFRDMKDIWVSNTLSLSKAYSDRFPLIKIGDILIRSKLTEKIEDDIEYNRVTIKLYGKGVSIRDTVMGKVIGTKNQWTIKEGQFIISKIDARNGAFGVVPHECDGAIATNDFPSFDVDHARITPEFLNLITTTKEFQNICELASTGTTGRRRVDMKKFLDMSIPLPDIATQKGIVSEYYAKIDEANRLDALVIEKEKEIENYLMDTLGITIKNSEKKVGLNFVRFKNLERWDVQNLVSSKKVESIFEMKKLGYFIERLNTTYDGKSLRVNTQDYPNDNFQYIGMEHIEKNTGVLLDKINVVGRDIKSQTVKVPIGYFLYGKLRPYLNKYWCNTIFDNVICSSEFFVFSVKKERIIEKYFLILLSSNIIQAQISDLMAGARMPRINELNFTSLEIPCPPLLLQDAVVVSIEKLKNDILEFKETAERLKLEAKVDFEKELFS